MQNPAKYVLMALILLFGGGEIWRRLDMLSTPEIQPVGMIAFGGLFLLCVISLAGFAMFKSGWLRWPFAVLLAAGSMLVDSYQWAVGDFMEYESFLTMMHSAGDIGSAMAQQGMAIALSAGKALLLLFAVGLNPQPTSHIAARAARWSAIPIVLVLTVLLFFRGGEGASGLPSSHSGFSYALLHSFEYLTDQHGEREQVSYQPSAERRAADIVLVIDESIAGAYLDINSDKGVYSGLANPMPSIAVHNFGLAASITHCSVGSNLALRFGGSRDNYRDTIRTKPSIWAYAKAVGMKTVYVDAQRTGGTYQNQMDDSERALIDDWRQFDDVPVLHRDHVVADKLAGYLNDNEVQFILVNKVGAHFPVNDKFPEKYAKYRPMLKRGQFADVTDTAINDSLDGRQNTWVLYRNSYRNTLLWNVGGFFDRLFARANIGDATIIYTSDHGQTFHERGEKGQATHCTPNPEIEEGLVPLVVIGGSADEQEAWKQAARVGKNQRSHYRIFPTILSLMGFDSGKVEKDYGPDLISNQPDPFTFNTRFNARLGSDPVWKRIPLEKVARPPVSDYSATRER